MTPVFDQGEAQVKIVELRAENIKRLTAVNIQPDGALVQITGRNSSGKSSVLDAIWWALEGAGHIQAEPIRKGADKALIRLDLGEIVVTRTFRRKDGGKFTTAITVENMEGARYQSPQTMIDELIGALTFDPLKFAKQPAKAQVETLKGFVADFDFDAADTANKADYDERTQVNRELVSLRKQRDALPPASEQVPELVDVDSLINQIAEAGETNAGIASRKAARERLAASIHQSRNEAHALVIEAESLRKRADDLEKEANAKKVAAETMEAELESADEIPDPVDTEALRTALDEARASNAQTQKLLDVEKSRAGLSASVDETQAKSEALTKAIGDRNAAKAQAVADARLPVDGIAFGEDHLLLNGVPFDQASDAEQLRVSTQIAIALNPQLRVIRIRDGSLLDDDAMKQLAEIADKNDFQIWIERVRSDDKVGFVIEDGHVKGQPVAEAAE